MIIIERALPLAVSSASSLEYDPRNRHFAEWRFLLFTIIVTVKGSICNVIRMATSPFSGGVANRRSV